MANQPICVVDGHVASCELQERYQQLRSSPGYRMANRFNMVVREIVGKRLTWDQLTGKVADNPPSVN
jgi:hypothetical protein